MAKKNAVRELEPNPVPGTPGVDVEPNHADAVRNGQEVEAQANREILKKFLDELKDWVTNSPKAAGVGKDWGPEPVAPYGIKVKVYPDNRFEVLIGEKVTTITAKDITPVPPTNINAVGGPVGGPIPDSPGQPSNRFYNIGGSKYVPGDRYETTDGSIYICIANLFYTCWLKVR
jgi:hypothetical protein